MKQVLKNLTVCLIMVLSSSVYAQGKDEIIARAIECHQTARGENVNESISECLNLLKPYKDTDSIACAFYGSAITIQAGCVAQKNPIKALALLDDGGAIIDKAVKMDETNAAVRLLRLENGIIVSRSSPVKRYSIISSDVNFFLEDEKLSQLDSNTKAEALLYCAYYKTDEGDLDYALELFEMAYDSDPTSDCGKQALKMLEKYSE